MEHAYIFDTETTGLKEPVIIEAAWIKPYAVNQVWSYEGKYCQRFYPGKPSELGALKTHHILDEELVDCPPSSDFKLPDDAEYIIGHNIDFDWQAIGKPEVKRICTQALSRMIWPDLDSHSQSALLYYLAGDQALMREKLKAAHSAAGDVENLVYLLDRIISHLNPVSFAALHEQSEKARIPTVFYFGKHKGQKIAEAPKDYCAWLLRQPDVDPYLAKALKMNSN